ncbi:MAG: tRNA 2-thiouridine(34) synthase MnmA [Clostridia bacterium]|nr:tRNA 2-thiouridine(34) synthase MnmA [Clostridia bacterium]
MSKKAIIAMSGGVDSSVAALLTKEEGYECIGATMQLFHNEDIGISRAKTCCSLDDINDARQVANTLGIPYYVFNFTENFKEKVIDKFVSCYENGCTPNPCIDCNRFLKFDKLFNRMCEIGYDYVVTGHYAAIEYNKKSNRYILKKAADKNKDQSYVLYSMTQNQLAHTLFPMGNLNKEQARIIAESHGFINAKKHDSQDLCFVPNGRYIDFIKKYTNKEYKSGNFIDKKGNVLGSHNGIIGYTIGQRKGLGVQSQCPLYVTDILADTNEIVLGNEEDLLSPVLYAKDFNWILYDNPPKKFRAKAKIRYRQHEQDATVFVLNNNYVRIEFDLPQRAVTKGQAVVLYDGDTVIGGGEICKQP